MNNEQKHFIKVISDWFFTKRLTSLEVAEFIGSQFALESNFGNSKLAFGNFNLNGMKVPKQRITVANDDGDIFASYSSLDLCLYDYTLLLAWNHFDQSILNDLKAFKKKLEACGYCPEPDYINKISNLLKSYKNE